MENCAFSIGVSLKPQAVHSCRILSFPFATAFPYTPPTYSI